MRNSPTLPSSLQPLWLLPLLFAAQTGPAHSAQSTDAWQQCSRFEGDAAARLACYDQWAARQLHNTPPPSPAAALTTSAALTTPAASITPTASTTPTVPMTPAMVHATPESAVAATVAEPATGGGTAATAAAPHNPALPAGQQIAQTDLQESTSEGCRNPEFNRTSRMWELSSETDCGNLRFRGYKPLIVAVTASDNVNRRPYSPSPDNQLPIYRDYQKQEVQIQMSMRTKLASNLLTSSAGTKRDSFWFAYTFSSDWQAFNGALSRPFRNTDHQPEFIYVYPLEWQLPGQARLRYAGAGLNHQSNGQSNPRSRSWNRYYAMLGLDMTPTWRMQGKWWQRFNESGERDDNPNISRYIGKMELNSAWDLNKDNTLSTTLRHSLSGGKGGSAKLEYFHTLGSGFAGGHSNLQLYTSLFHGYGNSLIDYNFKRTVFSVGFSLLDF